MKMSTKPYKGARDFYPEDKRQQKWLFNTWRRVVKSFGYEEYDAPILEPTDLYLMKGSEEIVKDQTYTFQDRGDRSVTIRTEMTPSVSRMVAGRRQELAYPLRWYSIPNMWRYERMQRGRLREFWQLNVDVFGVESLRAELEMIQIVDALFQAFGARRDTYVILLNSRLLLQQLLQTRYKLSQEAYESLVRLIDRKAKMSETEFKKALNEIAGESTEQIAELLEVRSLEELPKEIQSSASWQQLSELLQLAKSKGVSNVAFDISLMRGFDYYTDIVFEVFDRGGENNRSLLGGGRYDGLVGEFGAEPVSTVGFGVGDVVFNDFLETYKLLPQLANDVDVRVLAGQTDGSLAAEAAEQLRDNGLRVAVDYSHKKTDKQLKAAVKSNVRYVLFADREKSIKETFTLKDLSNGKELNLSLTRIVKLISDETASKET